MRRMLRGGTRIGVRASYVVVAISSLAHRQLAGEVECRESDIGGCAIEILFCRMISEMWARCLPNSPHVSPINFAGWIIAPVQGTNTQAFDEAPSADSATSTWTLGRSVRCCLLGTGCCVDLFDGASLHRSPPSSKVETRIPCPSMKHNGWYSNYSSWKCPIFLDSPLPLPSSAHTAFPRYPIFSSSIPTRFLR